MPNGEDNKDQEIYSFNTNFFKNINDKAYSIGRMMYGDYVQNIWRSNIRMPIKNEAFSFNDRNYDSFDSLPGCIVRYGEDTTNEYPLSSNTWPYNRIGFSNYFWFFEDLPYRGLDHCIGDIINPDENDKFCYNLMGLMNEKKYEKASIRYYSSEEQALSSNTINISAKCYMKGHDSDGQQYNNSFLIGYKTQIHNGQRETVKVYKSYESMNEILQKCYTNSPDWNDNDDNRLAGVSETILNFKYGWLAEPDPRLSLPKILGVTGAMVFYLNSKDPNLLQIKLYARVFNKFRFFNANTVPLHLYLHFSAFNVDDTYDDIPIDSGVKKYIGCASNTLGLKDVGPLDGIGHIRHVVIKPLSFYNVQDITGDIKFDVSNLLTVEEMAKIATAEKQCQYFGYRLNFAYCAIDRPKEINKYADATPLIPNYIGPNNGGVMPPIIIEGAAD